MKHKKRMKRSWKTAALTVCLSVISLLWLAPLFLTLADSFAPISAEEERTTVFLAQYRQILTETPVYLRMFWNSVILTAAIAAGSVVLSLLGAYGFTVLKFRGKRFLFYLYIVVMLLPLQVTMMPNYLVAGFFGVEDSWLAIILPAVFGPFGVFLLYQQMKILPRECMEAAKIDGAGEWTIFKKIMVPLIKPGIAALIMLLVIENWNLIDQAIIFIKKPEQYPLSIFLARMNEDAREVSDAATVYYMIPVLALLCYGHGYLREGIGLLNAKDR